MVKAIKNKKAWLKAVEVTIALTIVLGSVIYFSSNESQKEISTLLKNDFSDVLPAFLESLADNLTFRAEMLAATDSEYNLIENKLNSSLSPLAIKNGFDFYLVLSNSSDKVSLDLSKRALYKGKEIYPYERLFFSDTYQTNFVVKKITVFVWRR